MNNREKIQEEALDISLNYKKCGLNISMGVGKTRIAINHLIKNYTSTISALVVVPNNTIKVSWFEELQKMDAKDALLPHIEFSTYISLNKKDPAQYDIVYLDECHNLLESHEEFLSNFNGRILGLTGTAPVRKTSDKYRMVQKYCPIKYRFTVDEATSQNILNDYKIVIHELELSKLQNLQKKSKSGKTWYTSEYNDYAYYSKVLAEANTPKQMQFASIMRMRALMNYTTKEEYTKSLLKNVSLKCIIFANTQEQADRMSNHSFHSNNPNSQANLELFGAGKIKTLSCVLQLSEGITIPELKIGVIMHAYGNERKSNQRIGRLLRLNPSETATCHILCYKDTVDKKWVEDALSGFDQTKIEYYNPLKN